VPHLNQQQSALLGESARTVGNCSELAAIRVCQQARSPDAVCGQEATVVFNAITGIGLTNPATKVFLAER